jgi:hypothetical protein
MGILKRKALCKLIITVSHWFFKLMKIDADSRRNDQAEYIDGFVRPRTNEHAYETINSLRQQSLSMSNPVYCSEPGMVATMPDDGYAEIGRTSRNLVARHGHNTTAGHLNSRIAPYLHPQISENSVSVNRGPSPYLIPQPSLGKDNQITNLREHYEMQTIDQLTNETFATYYTNTVTRVVPTDPRTGYSTLLRPDELESRSANLKAGPMDPLYDSIKEKDVVLTRRSNPCSMPPLDAKQQASHHKSSDNSCSKPSLFESTSITQVSSSEIIDDPETGYSVLRPDKVPAASPPPGGACASVPHYDTIKLDTIKLQDSDGDISHSIKSTLTVSPSDSSS